MAYEDKAPVIQNMMQRLAPHGIVPGKCSQCGSTYVRHNDFDDDLSREEYRISRMCQNCQDETFGLMEN